MGGAGFQGNFDCPNAASESKDEGRVEQHSPGPICGRRLPEVEAFTASLPFDRRLFRHDIRGSIAHANMLAKVKLISQAEAAQNRQGPARIEREIEAGKFKFNISDEDIHIAIERRLIELAGDAGRKVHTARSRNDQVALDFRLFLKDEITRRHRAHRSTARGIC